MGTQIRFVQAPRGDATQAPPAIGETGQLGTSARAAREDHTHEGVHKVVAGGGIKVTPENGLGDVTVEALHWRPPVQSFTDLPTSGNQPGDARVVIGEGAIYVWTGGGWARISGDGDGGGGGGSGGGFVLDERLNHLRGQIRVSQLHGSSRVDLYSEVVDDFNDPYGIDSGRSVAYAVSASRLTVNATPNWYKQSPPAVPPARTSHAMAYDRNRGVVVLFGGSGATGVLQDTWEWDGTTWIPKNPTTKPSPRTFHEMIYDEARGVVILFGGYRGGTYQDDTWIWDGVDWVQLSPSPKPPGRSNHAMAYDARRGVVVLFGGQSGSQRFNDTWEWDGATWRQRTPATSPSARYGHRMVYDSRRGVIVLFGGYDGSTRNDTWEYDGETWVQKSPLTSPPQRYNFPMAYDESRGVVVLLGSNLNDMWEYDGNTWTQVNPETRPTARSGSYAVGSGGQGIMLFGGRVPPSGAYLDETWLYAIAGNAVVVTRPLALPWQPTKGYLTAIGEATSFALSRDGGQTFTPVAKDGWADLTSQPPGSQLVARVELSGSQSLDALAYGATNV